MANPSTKTHVPIRIVDLPPELVEHIARHVPPSDLAALRLASFGMEACVYRVWSETFFTDRTFLMSDRSSMNVLEKISAHKTLALKLKHIRFSPLTLPSCVYFEHSLWKSPYLESTRAEREANSKIIHTHFRMKKDERSFFEDRSEDSSDGTSPAGIRTLAKQHDERTAEDVRGTGGLDTVLTSIFGNFKRLGHYPDISFSKCGIKIPSQSPKPWGLARWRKMLKMQLLSCDIVHCAPDTSFKYHDKVYRAMVDNAYTPQKLELGQIENHVPLDRFRYRPHLFPGANLRELRLELATAIRYESDDKTPTDVYLRRRQELQCFATFLATMPQLKALKLRPNNSVVPLNPMQRNWFQDADRDIFHCLATKCYLDGTPIDLPLTGALLPQLEVLDISFSTIKLDRLLAFCAERRNTLHTVKLNHIMDDYQPNRSKVKRAIRSALGAEGKAANVSISIKNSFKGLSLRY